MFPLAVSYVSIRLRCRSPDQRYLLLRLTIPCESPPSRPPISSGTLPSGREPSPKAYTSCFSGVAGHPPPELRYIVDPIWTPPHPAGRTASLGSDPVLDMGVVVMSKMARPPPRGVTKTYWLFFSIIGQIGAMSGSAPPDSKAARATTSLTVNFLFA